MSDFNKPASYFIYALPAILAVFISGCEDGEKTNTRDDLPGTIQIAMIGPGPGDSNWPVISKAAETYAERDSIIKLSVEMPSVRSAGTQITLMNELYEKGSGIFVCMYSIRRR